MKIAATVTETAHACFVGGAIQRNTAIIEIPDDIIPQLVKNYLKDSSYAQIEFSLLVEAR